MSQNVNLYRLECNDNLLTCLNVKNGNNAALYTIRATNNPGLTCVEVDDTASAAASFWMVDPQVSFSTDCNNPCHNTIGISENAETPLRAYPNPFSVSTTIALPPNYEPFTLKVYDMLGNTVIVKENISGESVTIERGSLIAGVYFLEIRSVGNAYSGRFIID